MVTHNPSEYPETGVDKAPAKGVTILNADGIPVAISGSLPASGGLYYAYQSFGIDQNTPKYQYFNIPGGPFKAAKTRFTLSGDNLGGALEAKNFLIQFGVYGGLSFQVTQPIPLRHILLSNDVVSGVGDSGDFNLSDLADYMGRRVNDDFSPCIVERWGYRVWSLSGNFVPYNTNGVGFRVRFYMKYDV